jgi:hypothetical protein
MADPAVNLRRDVTRLVDRVQAAWQAAFGLELPAQVRLPNNPTGAAAVMEQAADQFTTGYDGAETTMAFTFDFSEFDGEDTLA